MLERACVIGGKRTQSNRPRLALYRRGSRVRGRRVRRAQLREHILVVRYGLLRRPDRRGGRRLPREARPGGRREGASKHAGRVARCDRPDRMHRNVVPRRPLDRTRRAVYTTHRFTSL